MYFCTVVTVLALALKSYLWWTAIYAYEQKSPIPNLTLNQWVLGSFPHIGKPPVLGYW